MSDCICQMHGLGQWLYDWQTLLGAILALSVGVITVRKIGIQIEQQDRLHDAGRSSRFLVAKAKSPLAAIAISDHAKTYLAACEQLLPLALSRSRQLFDFDGPPFPAEVSSVLDSLIENTNDNSLINMISSLYSENQVMISRLRKIRNSAEHSIAIDAYFMHPLILDSIAMIILEFGRDGAEIRQVTWGDVERSARSMVSDVQVRDRILAYIAKRREMQRAVPLAYQRFDND